MERRPFLQCFLLAVCELRWKLSALAAAMFIRGTTPKPPLALYEVFDNGVCYYYVAHSVEDSIALHEELNPPDLSLTDACLTGRAIAADEILVVRDHDSGWYRRQSAAEWCKLGRGIIASK